jgi:hypothetical protein
MTPVTAIIRSLREEPHRWCRYSYWLECFGRSMAIKHVECRHAVFDYERIDFNIIDRWRLRRAIKRWEKVNVA